MVDEPGGVLSNHEYPVTYAFIDFSDEDGEADEECGDGDADEEWEAGEAAERLVVLVTTSVGISLASELVETSAGDVVVADELVETAVGRTVGDRVVFDAGLGGSPLA
jgi:hypothetical protein